MIWPSVPEAAIVPVASDLRIVVAQHCRQRNQTHRDHGGTEDAGRRRQQGADEDHRNPEAARHGAEQLRHRHEQVFGDLRALQHDAHEYEQRNRNQGIAFDLPVDAAEVRHAGTQPVGRPALGRNKHPDVHFGIRDSRQIAASRTDRDDGGARQREGDRIARGESAKAMRQDQNGEEETSSM